MNKLLLPLLMLLSTLGLQAHPMGNFSVSHYARFQVTARGIELEYVLDLAEIPTFELLRDWKLERTSSQQELEKKAVEQAGLWLKKLEIASGGKPVVPQFQGADLVVADGAGDLPIVRITTRAHLDLRDGGTLQYEDRNFPDRAGWKEIVIRSGAGATLQKASQSGNDISRALTQYPPDPTIAPPQDLRAELEWTANRPVIARNAEQVERPVTQIVPVPQPRPAAPAAPPATMTPQAAPPGAVVRGDFLSRLLHQREITPWMMLVAIVAAFVLGAAHALTPGHGKTIVAAYLVGSRGTLKHAAFLGAMVTFTHTITVFALGLATLFLFRYIVPEKITQVLGAVSGLSIVGIGGWMLYSRMRRVAHSHTHAHDHHHHDHDHPHDHDHQHEHAHDHVHPHTHGEHHHHGHDHAHLHTHDDHHHHAHEHSHDHGPGGHTHMPDEISWGGLVALGASGGLVPCESALVLLLSAIALGRVGLGLILLVSFSLGLALVLMAIGVLVLYAKALLPESKRSGDHGFFRWMPIASATLVILVGLLMTGVSLGWIQPKWMIG